MGSVRENLTVICHQIRSPDNLGAVARLLANFGLGRLVLSEPVTYAFRSAAKLAVGAEHLLDKLTIATSLKEAVAGVVYALGTTSRVAPRRRAPIAPEEGARRLAEAAGGGRVALVLGGEKRGLSDDELALCQDVVVIPTDEGQPSMNLSQAAAVLLYLATRVELPLPPTPEVEAAPLSMLHAVEEALGKVLLEAGFLNPQAPEHVLRELVRTLARSRLTRREAELWLSALRHLEG